MDSVTRRTSVLCLLASLWPSRLLARTRPFRVWKVITMTRLQDPKDHYRVSFPDKEAARTFVRAVRDAFWSPNLRKWYVGKLASQVERYMNEWEYASQAAQHRLVLLLSVTAYRNHAKKIRDQMAAVGIRVIER